MDAVIADLSYLRDGTAALVGAVRLYLDRRGDDIRPLLDGFTVEELWDAQCLLVVSLCSLDSPDLGTLAARVRVVATRLGETDPSTDPQMCLVSAHVVDSFSQAAPWGGGIDIPTPAAAVSATNLYPWVMTFCLMNTIAALVWVEPGAAVGDATSVMGVVDEAAQAAGELVDLADADAHATATAQVLPRSPQERAVEVMRLTVLMLTGQLLDPGARQQFMVGKEPIQVGPYVVEAMLLATTAQRADVAVTDPMAVPPDVLGFRRAARALVAHPHPDANVQGRVVDVLAAAMGSTVDAAGVVTPVTRFSEQVGADELLTALAHVGDVIVQTVYTHPEQSRERLLATLEEAIARLG